MLLFSSRILFACAMFAHLISSPYTKATHNLLNYSPIDLSKYDHRQFPGVVPRSFVGPLYLYAIAFPFKFFYLNQKYFLMVRASLGLTLAYSLDAVGDGVELRFGRTTRIWFHLLNACQFHLAFWGSRTLGNVFALVLFNIALSYWLSQMSDDEIVAKINKETVDMNEEKVLDKSKETDLKEKDVSKEKKNSIESIETKSKLSKKQRKEKESPKKETVQVSETLTLFQSNYLTLFMAAAVIFRFELAIFIAALFISEVFIYKSFSFSPALTAFYQAFSRSIFTTILFDSWFWQELFFWPELKVFIFNVVENKSHLYGTLPFYAYFTELLLKVAPMGYPLGLLSFIFVPKTRRYLIPTLSFVLALSFVPHKEWRFVIYLIPVLNLCAASLCANLTTYTPTDSGLKKLAKKFLFYVFLLALLISTAGAIFSSWASSQNYPGGLAMKSLNELLIAEDQEHPWTKPQKRNFFVHIDSFNAQTGVSLFWELQNDKFTNSTVKYSKNEKHTTARTIYDEGYTHVLVESKREGEFMGLYDKVDGIQALDGIKRKDRETIFEDFEDFFFLMMEKQALGEKFEFSDFRGLIPLEFRYEEKSVVLRRKSGRLQKRVKHDDSTGESIL